MELKLAHKLGDHIERLKKLPEEKKKGIFSKIGNAMGITNSAHKNSMLAKSKILPLILRPWKAAVRRMQSLIRRPV